MVKDMPQREEKSQILYLDLLRGVAAICVLLLHWFSGHGSSLFGSSVLAVDFFFMLSGFVISYSYCDRFRNGYSFGKYMKHRFVRLYPLIVLGLIFGLIRNMLRDYVENGQFISGELFTQFLLSIFFIPTNPTQGLDLLYPLNTPMWSLLFEFVAYIAYGLFIFKLSNKFLLLLVGLLSVVLASWLMMKFGDNGSWWLINAEHPEGLLYGLGRVGVAFILGTLIHRSSNNLVFKDYALLRYLLLGVFVSILALPQDVVSPLVAGLIIFFFFPVVIITSLNTELSIPLKKLSCILGDISFPLYIIHVPLIWSFSGVLKMFDANESLEPVYVRIFVLPVVIVISYVVFHLYDKPMRKKLTVQQNK